MINVGVNVKIQRNVVFVKKSIFEILLDVAVKMANIYKALWTIH